MVRVRVRVRFRVRVRVMSRVRVRVMIRVRVRGALEGNLPPTVILSTWSTKLTTTTPSSIPIDT